MGRYARPKDPCDSHESQDTLCQMFLKARSECPKLRRSRWVHTQALQFSPPRVARFVFSVHLVALRFRSVSTNDIPTSTVPIQALLGQLLT